MDKRYLCVITAGSMLWFSVGCDGSSSSDGGTPPGTDAGTEADAGMRSDAGTPPDGRDGGGPPSPMTGCTNPNASNYDAAATINDGSCLFSVNFVVDMTGSDYDRADGVGVRGNFCDADCPTLTDADEDGRWEGTAELAPGSYAYRYVVTSDPLVEEEVPAFCQAEGSSERGFVVAEETVLLDPVAFARCTVLPVVVDGFYSASGFFGDYADVAVTETCPTRGGDGIGACRTWTYTRSASGMGFAGVFWQHPENNWENPGFAMPPGATRISFSAWGASGGETVSFLAGYGASNPSGDGFGVETDPIVLTTTPTDYTVSLVGVRYDTVAGGFGWVATLARGAGPLTFYIDDVQWERVPEDLADAAGCTDSGASNYNVDATRDDGSCLYPVTFEVDMSCPDPADAFSTVWVSGEFCEWCSEGFPLTDPDGDDVYTGTYDFALGPQVFKFMTNNFDSQENLIDEGGPGTCAPITDGTTYANREVNVVAGPNTVSATYGRCGGCP